MSTLIIWWSLSILTALTVIAQYQNYGSIKELNLSTLERLTLGAIVLNFISIPNCIATLMVINKYTTIEPILREIHINKGESDYEISKHLIS